jgi:hypothetical protein
MFGKGRVGRRSAVYIKRSVGNFEPIPDIASRIPAKFQECLFTSLLRYAGTTIQFSSRSTW